MAKWIAVALLLAVTACARVQSKSPDDIIFAVDLRLGLPFAESKATEHCAKYGKEAVLAQKAANRDSLIQHTEFTVVYVCEPPAAQ